MNMLLNTDSYKPSHWLQYPPNTTEVYSYIESRGYDKDNKIFKYIPGNETVFAGLQPYLMEYLSKGFTKNDIQKAEEILTLHGEPFNKDGWLSMYKKYGGRFPVEVKAVPEGLVIPTKNILVDVVNTDPEFAWLTSYIETLLLRLWYPITVATVSWRIKNVIREYLVNTADDLSGINFKLHDFGSRGVSSKESAGIGGVSHLFNFLGTDTLEAILYARKYYKENMAGFSIPAAEHSSITTWGKDREVDAYRNMLKHFAKPNTLLAVVSDSYDIYNATKNIWGKTLKKEVQESGATVVIRPDSGDPTAMVLHTLAGLAENFGFTVNSKGYKVLNNVRVIQGDGIDEVSIRSILEVASKNGFSADNIAFGMGGALLQQINRDTFKFAMKASSTTNDRGVVDVYKNPITDPGKVSKRGKLGLYQNPSTGQYFTARSEYKELPNVLQTVFKNGEILKEYSLEEIRKNTGGW